MRDQHSVLGYLRCTSVLNFPQISSFLGFSDITHHSGACSRKSISCWCSEFAINRLNYLYLFVLFVFIGFGTGRAKGQGYSIYFSCPCTNGAMAGGSISRVIEITKVKEEKL